MKKNRVRRRWTYAALSAAILANTGCASENDSVALGGGGGMGGGSGTDTDPSVSSSEEDSDSGGGGSQSGEGGQSGSGSTSEGSADESDDNPESGGNGDEAESSDEASEGSSEGGDEDEGEDLPYPPDEPQPKYSFWTADSIRAKASAKSLGKKSYPGKIKGLATWDPGDSGEAIAQILIPNEFSAGSDSCEAEVVIAGPEGPEWEFSVGSGSAILSIEEIRGGMRVVIDAASAAVPGGRFGCPVFHRLEVSHPEASPGTVGFPYSISSNLSYGARMWLPRAIHAGGTVLRVQAEDLEGNSGDGIWEWSAEIRNGEGSWYEVFLGDTGQDCDDEPLDGVFSACVSMTEGEHIFIAKGTQFDTGGNVVSGAGVMDTIIVPDLSLEASSIAQIAASPSPYNSQNMVEVSFGLDGAQDETEIVISGDVWGSTQGESFAVGGFSQVSRIKDGRATVLLDPEVIKFSQARNLTDVKNLSIRTLNRGRPVFEAKAISLVGDMPGFAIGKKPSVMGGFSATQGPAPDWTFGDKIADPSTQGLQDRHAMLFAHGWCTGGNGWDSSDFPVPSNVDKIKPVLSPGNPVSSTREELAELLYLNSLGYGSASVVGHSQGGLGGLHLLARYWSAMDRSISRCTDQSEGENLFRAISGNILTSVSTPWLGSGNWDAPGRLWEGYNCDGNPGPLWSEYCASISSQLCGDQGSPVDLSPAESILFLESYHPDAIGFVMAHGAHHPTRDLDAQDDPRCSGEVCDRKPRCTSGFLAWWNDWKLCDDAACFDAYPDILDDGVVQLSSQIADGYIEKVRSSINFGVENGQGPNPTEGECHIDNESKPYSKSNWVMWWPGVQTNEVRNQRIAQDSFTGECASYFDPLECSRSSYEENLTGKPRCGKVPYLLCHEIDGLNESGTTPAEEYEDIIHPRGDYSSLHRCWDDQESGQAMVCNERTISAPTVGGKIAYAACVPCDTDDANGCPSQVACDENGACPSGEICQAGKCWSASSGAPEWECITDQCNDGWCYHGGDWADEISDINPRIVEDERPDLPPICVRDFCSPGLYQPSSTCAAQRLTCTDDACVAECESSSDCSDWYPDDNFSCVQENFENGVCRP